MEEKKEERFIVAHLVDTDNDGQMDMVSFMNQEGASIGLAVKSEAGLVARVTVFQDVTGDGKMDDELFLRNKANELIKKEYTESSVSELIKLDY